MKSPSLSKSFYAYNEIRIFEELSSGNLSWFTSSSNKIFIAPSSDISSILARKKKLGSKILLFFYFSLDLLRVEKLNLNFAYVDV